MFGFFTNKEGNGRGLNQKRKSGGQQCISPLSYESWTDENRYYRSAEFRQALLQQENERSSLLANRTSSEDTGRRSRYHRSKSTSAPRKPNSHLASDNEADNVPRFLPDNSTQTEASPPAYDTTEAPSPAYSTSNKSLATEESHLEQPKGKATRPRILTEGISPLVQFARSKKLE